MLALAGGLVVTVITLWGGRASSARGAVLLIAYAVIVVAFWVAGDRDDHAEASPPTAVGTLVSGYDAT